MERGGCVRYYISDLHFFHEALNTKMDCRGFDDARQMNERIIEIWNRKVRKNDEVVILGDLSLGGAEETNEVLERLKGRLFFFFFNHDTLVGKKAFKQERFGWIRPYAELHDNGRKVVLCHYPVFCYNGQYRRNQKGNPRTYMLYGHVHATLDQRLVDTFCRITGEQGIPCQMINCFCMYSGYEPLTLDEWIINDKKRDKGGVE